MATLYENYITGDDNWHIVFGDAAWYAQTFTPSVDHIISSVKLKLFRVGSPGTVTVSIRAVTANKPSGNDKCVGTTDGDTLTTDTDGEWREIIFTTGALLLASTQYAIVVRISTAVPLNYLSWRNDNSSPAYTDGAVCTSGDSGSSWTLHTGNDEMFEEWGDPQGSGEGGAIFPSDDVARVSSIRHIFRPGLFAMQVALGALGFDIDIAEASVRAALDTAKEVEEAPPEPAETYEQRYLRLYGVPPPEMRAEPGEAELREADPGLWRERDRMVREQEERRQRLLEESREQDARLWRANEELKKRQEDARRRLAEEITRLQEVSEPLETRVGNYVCSHCGMRFSTARALATHIGTAHPGEQVYGRGIYGGGL